MPILVGFGIPFFAFAAALVLVGLSQTHTAAHGSTGIKGFLESVIHNSLVVQIFGLAKKATSYVITHFAARQLKVLARWFLSMAALSGGWFASVPLFAEAITHAVERVEHRGDPKARAQAKTANRHAGAAARSASRANAHSRTVGHALDRFKAYANPRIAHATHAVDVTLPRDIGRVRTREDALSRDLGKLRERTKALEDGAADTWDWIRSHPLSGVTGVFTGAVAIALARLGYGFLRCRSWRSVGRRLTCGMGAWIGSLLDLIATFGLATVSVLDPEALAEATVAVVDTVEPILSEILSR